MKMTHREFLIWLSGLGSLGLLGGLVKHKMQPTPVLEPEKPFKLPKFAVRVKHVANGVLFDIDRARKIVTAHEEADGKLLWESHGESQFIIPGAAFPIDLSPEGELW
ncbi:MAG: hypothetical protein IKZ84_13000, partial [Victivallales bacterium]|nr:hypothetical protein [Victivallales bacterium]